MIGIYKIENLVNGKMYIGQSIDIETRWKQHKKYGELDSPYAAQCQKKPLYGAMKKYGIDNFSFTVLETCKQEELNEKERKYIHDLHTYIRDPHCNGYNLTTGGDGQQTILKEEYMEYIKLWQDGLAVFLIADIMERNKATIKRYLQIYEPTFSQEEHIRRTKKQQHYETRRINQYSLDGTYIKQYNSLVEAARAVNGNEDNISDCAKGKLHSCMEYFWIFSEDNQQEKLAEKLSKNPRQKLINKQVEQYSLEGEYIKTYKNIYEVAEKYNVKPNTINKSCKKDNCRTAGFQWRYVNSNKVIQPYMQSLVCGYLGKRKVKQYDLNNNFIKEYNSLSDAAKAIGAKSSSGIYNCCQHKSKTCHNYKWAYAEEGLNI